MKTTEYAQGDTSTTGHSQTTNYAGVAHALLACEETCNACADACLEDISRLESYRRGIRLSLDCGEVCGAMLRLLMRQTGSPNELIRAQLRACAIAAQLCAEEWSLHQDESVHCQVCAEVCRHCHERCSQLLGELVGVANSSAPFGLSWS